MKLQTSIKPRRDGTVNVYGQDRQTYVFVADADGLLSGDVADEATVAKLVESGLFWPADEKDAERALEIVKTTQVADETDDESDDADEASLDEAPAAAPVETNTAPKPKRERKPKAQ